MKLDPTIYATFGIVAFTVLVGAIWVMDAPSEKRTLPDKGKGHGR